jgi:hypothetical protein
MTTSRSESASHALCWTSPLAWGLRCGLGTILAACGGAEFTNAIAVSEDAGIAVDAGYDAGSSDAGSSNVVDAGVVAFKDSGAPSDSALLDNGALDAGIDTGVSCITRSAMTESACDTTVTYPNNFCAFVITAAVSAGEYVIETTPAACAAWCDFSCACLVEAGACPGQADCWPRPDGTLTLECDER